MGTLLIKNAPYANALKDKGLLYSGAVISKETMREIEIDPESWSERLVLRRNIESCGFFVTERGCPEGEFRILESKEMADYAKKQLLAATLKKARCALILGSHQPTGLTESEEAKFNSTKEAAMRDALSSQNSLMENFDVNSIFKSNFLPGGA